MDIQKTSVDGALLLEFKGFTDDRGFFTRTFCTDQFQEAGLSFVVKQANWAGSSEKGTLRGLHYQQAPFEEEKVLHCVKGRVFDVVADVRPKSATYGLWFGAELSALNRKYIFVPKGCAHGYLTLEDNCEVYYLVSEFYNPDAEMGIRWDDPAFRIDWPLSKGLILSEKDKGWPDFKL